MVNSASSRWISLAATLLSTLLIASARGQSEPRLPEETLRKLGVPFEKIGTVGGGDLVIGKEVKVGIDRLSDLFFTSIEKMMA